MPDGMRAVLRYHVYKRFVRYLQKTLDISMYYVKDIEISFTLLNQELGQDVVFDGFLYAFVEGPKTSSRVLGSRVMICLASAVIRAVSSLFPEVLLP